MVEVLPEVEDVFNYVEKNGRWISDFHQEIWNYAETAWREYKSAAAYVELLRNEGFEVEEGSGGMPTAFCALWGEGKPVIGGYAEYDAVPGFNQAAEPYPALRDEKLHRWAAGHTDPHSALGAGALFGFLAAKKVMEENSLEGTLKFLGEPAEKVCGSKAIHAAKGYFDDFDASICYHPWGSNGVTYDFAWGSYWSNVYTFETIHPDKWFRPEVPYGRAARIPGALDAVCLMYTTTKYTQTSMLPRTANWTMNEFLMVGGQCTSDNVPPKIGQIQYAWRSPLLAMQEQIERVLDNNAKGVGVSTGTKVTKRIVARMRVGLANKKISEVVYRNLQAAGPPEFGEDAKTFVREIQRNLDLEPMEDPFTQQCQEIAPITAADDAMRSFLPPWVETSGSDDYVEYTWNCPSTRLYTSRAIVKAPEPGYRYPSWARLAMGGRRETIDPTILTAAKTIGASIVDLIIHPDDLASAKQEFVERTGGGVGGSKWVAPLLPKDFYPPIDLPWPEYVTTARGTEWSLPKMGPEKEYKVIYEGI